MSSYEILEGTKAPVFTWTTGVEFEEAAKTQLRKLALLPFIFRHIAVMPDCHYGNGSTVGTVVATKDAVIPTSVGADLYCGMYAVLTNLHISDLKDLPAVRHAIETKVPHGRTNDGGKGDRGAWFNTPQNIKDFWDSNLEEPYQKLVKRQPGAHSKNTFNHLGTLGGGNHFIEVNADTQDRIWIMLHSGSRGMGARFGQHFTNLAREMDKKWHIQLPDPNLAYLPRGTDEFEDYLLALKISETFAYESRRFMMDRAIEVLHKFVKTVERDDMEIHCHHNYISFEHHLGEDVIVTRKGAIQAKKNQLGLIPGSMGAKSYIVCGLGNPLSYSSASHGAGRKMSRGDAKRSFTAADHILATEGIECRKDKDVVDETPMAYKDVDKVMEAQEDLVEVVETLRQLICIKG